jgi:hypothetical protein
MNKRQEFRTEVSERWVIPVDELITGVDSLREMVEATISANISVGPPKGDIPANKSDKAPKRIGSDDHGIKQIEIDDIDDDSEDDDENMNIQAGSGSVNEVLEIINEMDEDEFDEYANSLDEESLEILLDILAEGQTLVEETDEDEPDDVEPIEVDNIEDTDDDERGHAFGDIKAGSGMGVDVKENFRQEIFQIPSSIYESHFDLGDKVKCNKSGMVGAVIKSEGEGDSEVYHVQFPNGKVMQYAPTDISEVDDGYDIEETIHGAGTILRKGGKALKKGLDKKGVRTTLRKGADGKYRKVLL